MYISTPALAKGYLNQPERTEQSFIENPFAIGEKIYKSGDIAKLLDTGYLEYVGRSDSQLKIRGHRIEIGEIEDHLARLEQIQDVAVIPKKKRMVRTCWWDISHPKMEAPFQLTDIKRHSPRSFHRILYRSGSASWMRCQLRRLEKSTAKRWYPCRMWNVIQSKFRSSDARDRNGTSSL